MNFMERNLELRELIRSSAVKETEIGRWKEKIWKAYLDLARDLPDGHVWKEGKLKHAEHGMEEAREHASLLGLEGVEVDAIGFLFFAHDVGRLSQALRVKRNEFSIARLHGVYSVNILMEYLEVLYVTPFWRTFFAAIAWHAMPRTPTLQELGDDRAALALTTLLRDMDKREGFLKASQYTEDESHKRKQMEANWPSQRKIDPTWGEEKRSVEPARLVEKFARQEPIDRDECESYEAYMLQYLGWVFDVANPEILKLIFFEGGPQIVFLYLERQISGTRPEQWIQIRQKISRLVRILDEMK